MNGKYRNSLQLVLPTIKTRVQTIRMLTQLQQLDMAMFAKSQFKQDKSQAHWMPLTEQVETKKLRYFSMT